MATVSLAFLVGPVAPAGATGNLSCTIDDKTLTFDAESGFSHGLGGGFINFRAQMRLKAPGVPEALKNLDGAALAHHWFHGPEIRLHLYWETESGPHAYVELVLDTKASGADEEAFKGRYTLTVYEVPEGGEGKERTFYGRAECSAG